MKTKLFLAAIGLLSVTMAYSQIGSDQNFSDLDASDNNMIEKNEYKVNSNVFGKWDVNDDKKLSKSEFQTKVLDLIGIDSDEMNDSIEWNQAQVLLNATNNNVDMSPNDMKIGMNEFNQKLSSTFIKIDSNKDNSLSQSEFNNYSFKLLDLNNDGNISEDEFKKVKDVMKGKPFWKEWFD